MWVNKDDWKTLIRRIEALERMGDLSQRVYELEQATKGPEYETGRKVHRHSRVYGGWESYTVDEVLALPYSDFAPMILNHLKLEVNFKPPEDSEVTLRKKK